MNTSDITGQLVDVCQKRIYPARIVIQHGKIAEITPIDSAPEVFIIPGFVDAHVHIESSMLTPSQFARLAVVHGTIATVSDPHEIGNVLGLEGVRYMIENGKMVPFYFNFGAPSCVPATIFETAGAEITVDDVQELLQMEEIKYLAEMMNYPGVLQQDATVMAKIDAAKKVNKPVDGHAPGLRGEQALKYIEAGISTDHECFTAEEALDKLKGGMKILIREGSAAKNFEALIGLLPDYPDQMMFCSDDKHPDSLVDGHINVLAARAVEKGCDVFDVLQVACINPVLHYKLDSGLIRVGDNADLIVVQNLKSFKVLQTYIKGSLVAENGQTNISSFESKIINHFDVSFKSPDQFLVKDTGKQIFVIEAIDGQLITNKLTYPTLVQNGYIQSDVEKDILKIAVVNRYHEAPAAIGFIKNMGLKEGALASSVAHDSHNIIVVGVDDDSICKAVNLIIEAKGGLAGVTKHEKQIIPLPIAGLMTGVDGYQVAQQYANLDLMAKKMGSTLLSPFMTLSFMALLVIPSLKLSDKGLFDGDTFQFVPVVR
ncbi:adenine deaminase [Xanthocytophaga agilis]|uniref:Adenine deaminase n=1 Tax=Xanthocytophaga agilis TaxID=3048010 RepID=A0AAE3R1P8_9BACT|nr:adenine deaminase [Xanthocytophaga agilis]MDJ1499704.1 adenine deaminase [Xanthocytophaga agilis]